MPMTSRPRWRNALASPMIPMGASRYGLAPADQSHGLSTGSFDGWTYRMRPSAMRGILPVAMACVNQKKCAAAAHTAYPEGLLHPEADPSLRSGEGSTVDPSLRSG